MGRPPAFLFYPSDFSSDGKVEAMTTEQVGAYILMLCKAWMEEPAGSIPNDDQILARWARMDAVQWAGNKQAVLSPFTLGTDCRWHQKRMRLEYDTLCAVRKRREKAGKKAAAERWMNKGENANRTAIASKSHAIAKRNACISSSSSIKEKRTIVEDPTGIAGTRAPAERARDPYWDSLADIFGPPTTPAGRTEFGRVVAQIKSTGVPPGQIKIRAGRLVSAWGDDKLTINSLLKHWDRFGKESRTTTAGSHKAAGFQSALGDILGAHHTEGNNGNQGGHREGNGFAVDGIPGSGPILDLGPDDGAN